MDNEKYLDFAIADLTIEEQGCFMHYLAGAFSVRLSEEDWRPMVDSARRFIERRRTSTRLPDSAIVKTDKPV